jgi:hypothetical protein
MLTVPIFSIQAPYPAECKKAAPPLFTVKRLVDVSPISAIRLSIAVQKKPDQINTLPLFRCQHKCCLIEKSIS